MKDRPDAILRAPQAAYLERLLPPRERLLAEMEEFARLEDVPISDPEVAACSRPGPRLLRAAHPGNRHRDRYGTLCLARGASAAQVFERGSDPPAARHRARFPRTRGVLERVQLIEGRALEVIPSLEGPFDLVYLDASRPSTAALDLSCPSGGWCGLVVADNLLWKGLIAEPPADDRHENARALRAFNAT